jgi:peptidoglycan/LPS O-acetylase OafA/YrhL
MPELDSLRGLAVLSVLFFHGIAPPMNPHWTYAERMLLAVSGYGWVGVNLFFVLSGFLITGILVDSKNDARYYSHFYARRALRILPALWCMLLVLLIAARIDWRFFGLSALFLANSATLLGMTLQYGPLWSLAVEEHFYFLWPAAVKNLQRRGWIAIAVFIFLVTPVLRWLGYEHAGRPGGWVSLYTWCNLDGLALGALLAVWVRTSHFRREHLARVAFPLLLIGFAGCVLSAQSLAASAILLSSACNIAALGLISCALLIGTSERKILVDRPALRFFGWLSYGLYLVHVFAFHVIDVAFGRGLLMLHPASNPVAAMLLRFALGSALAIGLAYLSRRSLEAKFLATGVPYHPRPETRRESWPTNAKHHAWAKE